MNVGNMKIVFNLWIIMKLMEMAEIYTNQY